MDIATTDIWNSIITKPKWYAGIRSATGTFYTAQSAAKVKKRFEEGTLSFEIIETVLNAHGYHLIKQWQYRGSSWD